MKICFLIDSIFSYGGVQRVSAVIAKALSERHEVTIMTFDDEKNKNLEMYGLGESNINYEFLRYPNVGKIKNFACKAYSFIYRKLLPKKGLFNTLYSHSSFPSEKKDYLEDKLRRGNYDVVIGTHIFLAARLGSLRKQLKGVNLIGWIHNSYDPLFGVQNRYFVGPELAPYYIWQFQKLNHTVVLTHQDAKVYKEKHNLQVDVIYNPLTLVPGERSKGNSKRFLAVGRFENGHKGFDLLIKAFAIFAKRNSDWCLDIVGDGPERKDYEQLIKENSLEKRVFLHPFTNNIQQYYSNAQIYVLSSRWEGFGLVLIEAMSHGLPIVSSDLPTSKEIIGTHAHYFPVGDINALASTLEKSTEINWQQESDDSIAWAQRFSVESITKEWENLFQ